MRGTRGSGATALLLLCLFALLASAQPSCSLQEERRWGSLTARFSIGSTTANLTLPGGIARYQPLTVFMEVSGGEPDLVFESGSEKAALKNGGALHLVHRPGERLEISLSTRDGRRLCTWRPQLVYPRRSVQASPGFSRYEALPYRNLGDPIVLGVGGESSREPGEFQIDGVPAPVLARTPSLVILRDPQPATGLRTVGAPKGYGVTLRFVDVEWQLPQPGRDVLGVKVVGLHDMDRPAKLVLVNYNRNALTLRCGKDETDSGAYMGLDELRSIPITPDKVRDGEFAETCRVRLSGQGRVDIGAFISELPRLPRRPPSSLPRPPWIGRAYLSNLMQARPR